MARRVKWPHKGSGPYSLSDLNLCYFILLFSISTVRKNGNLPSSSMAGEEPLISHPLSVTTTTRNRKARGPERIICSRNKGKKKGWVLNAASSFDYNILSVPCSYFFLNFLMERGLIQQYHASLLRRMTWMTRRHSALTDTYDQRKMADSTGFSDHTNLPLGVPSCLFFEQAHYLFARCPCT